MRNIISLLALLVLATASAPRNTADKPADFPQATITNGLIEAHLFLPDAKEGYYRGPRFDWAGVMSDLKYKDHTYFGQ